MAADDYSGLSFELVRPLDWFQLRCLLWEALPNVSRNSMTRWSQVADLVNARCPASAPADAAACEAVIARLAQALPEAASLTTDPSTGPRVWNHLLYGAVHDRFPTPTFMNLGFLHDAADDRVTPLDAEDEPERLFIQLYERTINGIDLSNLDVAEVGCGAGGGARYVWRYHRPRSFHGIDLVSKNIEACRRWPTTAGLTFSLAAAEALPLPDTSADAIVNIESSFTYEFDKFLHEVRRVLRPGGYLMLADHRPVSEEWGAARTVTAFRQQLHDSALRVLRDDDITAAVVRASVAMADAKQQWLAGEQLQPQDLSHFTEILHCADSQNHQRLMRGDWQYRCVLLQK